VASKTLERLRALVGTQTPLTWFTVTPAAVARFADAVGAPLEWYTEVAPPTFPITFREGQRPETDGLPEARRLHASQEFRYNRPIRVGEEIGCSTRVTDAYQRVGRSGVLTFVVYETTGIDRAGEVVFTATRTRVYRG